MNNTLQVLKLSGHCIIELEERETKKNTAINYETMALLYNCNHESIWRQNRKKVKKCILCTCCHDVYNKCKYRMCHYYRNT